MRSILMISAIALLTNSAVATAQINNPSEYRQVDKDGVGNCIFSTGELSYQNESAPGYSQITTSFKAPSPVHMRCYYPSILKPYESKGKVFNSLRDDQVFVTDLELFEPTVGNQGPEFIEGARTRYDDNWKPKDQSRFDIMTYNCDFSCPDLEDHTRYVANRLNEPLPFTAKYCVTIKFFWADRMVERWENGVKLIEPDKGATKISQGCFDYTVTE